MHTSRQLARRLNTLEIHFAGIKNDRRRREPIGGGAETRIYVAHVQLSSFRCHLAESTPLCVMSFRESGPISWMSWQPRWWTKVATAAAAVAWLACNLRALQARGAAGACNRPINHPEPAGAARSSAAPARRCATRATSLSSGNARQACLAAATRKRAHNAKFITRISAKHTRTHTPHLPRELVDPSHQSAGILASRFSSSLIITE
jgi:hypothetical protein